MLMLRDDGLVSKCDGEYSIASRDSLILQNVRPSAILCPYEEMCRVIALIGCTHFDEHIYSRSVVQCASALGIASYDKQTTIYLIFSGPTEQAYFSGEADRIKQYLHCYDNVSCAVR